MGKIILPPGMENPLDDGADEKNEDKFDLEADLKKTIDEGQGYGKLEDWYYDSIHNFCLMLSRTIPDKFKKETDHATEKFSCGEGAAMFKTLIDLTNQKRKGRKLVRTNNPENVEDYNRLRDWYLDAVIEFTNYLDQSVPDKFHESTPEKTNYRTCNAAIKACRRAITTLEKI